MALFMFTACYVLYSARIHVYVIRQCRGANMVSLHVASFGDRQITQ